MQRVALVVASGLPIPATKGGAIETLLQFIIDENEKSKKLDLTVISVVEEKANVLRRDYRNTQFIVLKPCREWYSKAYSYITRIARKVFRISINTTPLVNQAFRYVRKHAGDFDLIINEHDPSAWISWFGEKLHPTPILFHFHYTDRTAYFKYAGRYDGVICCSQFVSDVLPKSKKQASHSYVLKNQIEPVKFVNATKLSIEEKRAYKAELGIHDDKFIVLYIGRILEGKGVLQLMKAVGQFDHISLLLVGSSFFAMDSKTTEYEKKVAAEAKNSRAQIIQTGFVANDQLYKYQGISDVQVVPSFWEEAAGLVVLEAQAAGLPVVATRRGGIPEFLGEGAGMLIEADDQLEQNIASALKVLMDNPEKCDEMRVKGLQYAKSIGSKRYFDDFCEIVEKAVGNANE